MVDFFWGGGLIKVKVAVPTVTEENLCHLSELSASPEREG